MELLFITNLGKGIVANCIDSTIAKIDICSEYFFGQIVKYKLTLQRHRIGAKNMKD